MEDDHALGESSENRQPSPEVPPLPAASVLSHQHPHLTNPSWADPSDLLCSLLPASLSTVAQQLSAFDNQLTDELQAVVDAEHRDFIALASKLGGEKQRIDRLTYWAAAGPSPSTAAISRDDSLAPSKGLEGIRKQVESEQIHIQQSQHDVQRLVHTKTQLDNRTAHLHLLLSFTDALQRIESLLGITYQTVSVDAAYKKGHPTSLDTQPHLDDDEDEDDDDDDIQLTSSSSSSPSDTGYSSDDSIPTGSAGLSKRTPPDSTPRRSLTHANGPPSTGLRRGTADLDLPTKIHRAKSSWEQLDFRTKAALAAVETTPPDAVEEEQGSPLLAYLTAHNHRVDAVRSAIKKDCAHLFRILLQSDSLLYPQAHPTATSQLTNWSQIDSQKQTDPDQLHSLRYQEQRTWLNLVLQTWFRLDVDPSQTSHEVRDILSSHTITPWASRYITLHRRTSSDESLPRPHDVLLPIDNEPFSNSPFVHLFNDVLTYVNTLTPVLSLLEDFDSSFTPTVTPLSPTSASQAQHARPLRAFQLVVWDEIAAALTDQVGSQLFFVGRLEEFRANYQTTWAFLDALGKLAPSDVARRSWRTSPSYISFMKRWQLSVYFQMRYRAIAGKLELELQSSPSLATVPISTTLPLLPASRRALEAFTSPWAPDGHLDALCPRQWKLSMLVVARFNVWLQANLPESLGRHGIISTGGQSTLPNATTQAPSRTATPDGDAQSRDDEMLKQLSVLVADAMWFQDALKTQFDQVISTKIGDAALSEQMKAALLDCLSFEQDALPAISARIVDLLKARSAEPLRLVRSVNTSSYRSPSSSTTANTDTTLPEASYFIPQFFRPLKSFFGVSPTSNTATAAVVAPQVVPQDIKVKWATQVIDDVAKRYAASLTQMIQNYESLKRLKRGGPSATGSGGGFSGFATSWLGKTGASTNSSTSQNASGAASQDPEAIRMQLQMRADVTRLEQDVADLASVGVPIDLSSLESWQNLHSRGFGSDM